jgi:hypothetical protein
VHGLPTVTAELRLLATAEGGRAGPLSLAHPTAYYRPHLVIDDPGQRVAVTNGNMLTEEYVAVQLERAETVLRPGGSSQQVRMTLLFFPGPQYVSVQPGAQFTLREGAKVVGYGTILTREDDTATSNERTAGPEHP